MDSPSSSRASSSEVAPPTPMIQLTDQPEGLSLNKEAEGLRKLFDSCKTLTAKENLVHMLRCVS